MADTTPSDSLSPFPPWRQVAEEAAPLLGALGFAGVEPLAASFFRKTHGHLMVPHSDPWLLTLHALWALVFWALLCFGRRLSPQPAQAAGGSAWRTRFAMSLGRRGKALLVAALLCSSALILTAWLSLLFPTVSAWIGQLPYWPLHLILAGHHMHNGFQWWPFWMSVYYLVWARGSTRSNFRQVASENG